MSDKTRTADHLRRLQSVADAALAHLTLADLLDELLVRIRDALAADTAAVLLLDEETHELVVRAAHGLEEAVERGIRIPLGRGFAGRVAAERRPVVIPQVDARNVLNPILREKGVTSLVGVPLVVHGTVIGVLHVGSFTRRDFSPDEIEFVQLAADRAAIAIEHGRLFEETQRLSERLAKLQSVTEAALAHLNVDELLDELLERIRDLLGVDTCAVLLLDEETGELVARAARGLEEDVEAGVRIPVGRGFAGRIAAERRPLVVDDVDHADVLNPLLRAKGVKSLVGAPLVARGKVLGVIHVGTLTRRAFTDDDVELLGIAAERAALGLEKALLHEQLMRLDQLRHAFVSIASHELRTPTATVLGAALTLLERAGQLSPEQEHELKIVLAEQAKRLASLLEQLLDLSRLEAHAIEIKPQRLRLRAQLEKIIGDIAPDKRALITLRAPAELEADADPVALERVVSNLVVNAFHHGRPPVVVSATRNDAHLRITVDDHGPGVPPDVRPRLFEQFARSAASATKSGSGLGLAIARSYARAHGGDLVHDTFYGRGARFRLLLPADSGASR